VQAARNADLSGARDRVQGMDRNQAAQAARNSGAGQSFSNRSAAGGGARDSALSGVRQPDRSRASASRGQASRASAARSRPAGGMRGGGGRRR
jgi:hypothetical protein